MPIPSQSVLLADDSVMNQRLTESLLVAEGQQVTVVSDGRQAVDAWANGPFDFILMDVEMPVMDGLAAIAAIRADELQTGGHIPIIAMTARAMEGDRESCLAAGADGYLAKPVDRKRLFAAIGQCVPRKATEITKTDLPPASEIKAAVESAADCDDDVFNLEAAQRLIPGGAEGVQRMVPILMSECAKHLGIIREGLAEADAGKVQRGAHTIKGSAGVFAAKRVVAAARQLEEIGRQGVLTEASAALKQLENEIERLTDAIETSGIDNAPTEQ